MKQGALINSSMRIVVVAMVFCVLAVVAIAQDISLPNAAIEDGFKKAECTVAIESAAVAPESFDLGDGKRLLLVSCWRAAYQNGSIAFITNGVGAPRMLTFQDWDGKHFVPSKSLTDPDFDPGTKTMSSFHKGRGMGGCGSIGHWRWTGSEFKLTEYFYKAKCDDRSFTGDEKRWQIFPRRY